MKTASLFLVLISTFLVFAGTCSPVLAADEDADFSSRDFGYLPTVEDGGLTAAKSPAQVAVVLQTVALLTFITLAPSILLLMTCFTRIIVVLSFLRRALSTQTLPPDQVMIGLALFLTIFIMAPTWGKSWDDGLRPFLDGEMVEGKAMTQQEAFDRVMAPQRDFMFTCLEGNGGSQEIYFFMGISGREVTAPDELRREDVPLHVLVPAFITSELKRAFWMGFLLYLPFLILDMVIASVLMSMGMMMLPPVMISLPFKIILFVLVDGWRLLLEGLVTSFPAATGVPLPGV